MVSNENDVIFVKMLGDFSMSYMGKKLDLKNGNTTKAMQILQLLLYTYPGSVSKETILKKVFEFDDLLNPSNNLKVTVSQLRATLNKCNLPCDEFISFSKSGYSWSCPIKLEIDKTNFELSANLAFFCDSESQKFEYCKDLLRLYTGKFLPELFGIDWVESVVVYYEGIYSKAVRYVTKRLLEQGEYREAYKVFDDAAGLLASEEWQIGKIECRMKLGEWNEAKKIYQDTVSYLEKELNVGPSPRLLEKYKTISEKTDNAMSSFDNMLDFVKEKEDSPGAYYCPFPGFIDSCRVLSRNMERNGFSCYLMLMFVGDISENVIDNTERLEAASNAMFSSIQSSLRRGDMFTQYNKSQFLVFLFGTTRENSDLVANRIIENYRHFSVRGTRIKYEVTSALLENFDENPANGSFF